MEGAYLPVQVRVRESKSETRLGPGPEIAIKSLILPILHPLPNLTQIHGTVQSYVFSEKINITEVITKAKFSFVDDC